MKTYAQLAAEGAPAGPHVMAAAGDFLDVLLEDLYRRAKGQAPSCALPIPVIHDTGTATAVLRDSERFTKNYFFLHIVMPGRLSANGEDWKSKARLTQRFYSAAFKTVPRPVIDGIYQEHLLAHNPDASVFETLVSAAVAVVSRAYGLPHTLAWPEALINRIRCHTVWLQAMGWVTGPAAWQTQALAQLQALVEELFEQWSQDDATLAFLRNLATEAGASLQVAQQELLQNMFAATETTASSVCWMLDVLSRNEGLCHVVTHADGHERGRFINESLRLFPPVPMVTRECTALDPLGVDAWHPGQNLVISMVGLHTQASEWTSPLKFDHNRAEWMQASAPPSFIPFLYGPRICGGRKLAMEELHSALSAALHSGRLEPVGDAIQFHYSLTSRPKHPPRLFRPSHNG